MLGQGLDERTETSNIESFDFLHALAGSIEPASIDVLGSTSESEAVNRETLISTV